MSCVTSDSLTDKQLRMVMDSGEAPHGSGYGVDLHGANWKTARSLVAKGLGFIEGGAPNGSDFPGLYFNSAEGVELLHEFDDEDDGCPVCGLGHGDLNHTHWVA